MIVVALLLSLSKGFGNILGLMTVAIVFQSRGTSFISLSCISESDTKDIDTNHLGISILEKSIQDIGFF